MAGSLKYIAGYPEWLYQEYNCSVIWVVDMAGWIWAQMLFVIHGAVAAHVYTAVLYQLS